MPVRLRDAIRAAGAAARPLAAARVMLALAGLWAGLDAGAQTVLWQKDYYAAPVASWTGLPEPRDTSAASLAVDPAGDVLATGSYDGFTTIMMDNDEMITAKLAGADGTVLWTRTFNGPYQDFSRAVAVDAAGNAVITGSSMDAKRIEDMKTTKYAGSTGETIWDQTYNGSSSGRDEAHAIALDRGGNAVVAGHSAVSGDRVKTIKYASASGALLWQQTGPPGQATALAIDAADDVLVTAAVYDPGQVNGNTQTFKYAGVGGALLWQRRIDNASYSAMAIDANGDVFVVASDYWSGVRVVKYAGSNGFILWERSEPLLNIVFVRVAADPVGGVAVVALSNNGDQLTTIKYAAGDGARAWQRSRSLATPAYGEVRLRADARGNAIVLAGAVALKYAGADGTTVWEHAFGGTGMSMALAPDTIYLGGTAIAPGYTVPGARVVKIDNGMPQPFSFAPQAGVAPSSAVASQAITPVGFARTTQVSVAGGEYSVGCTGVFTSVAGTIDPGQSVCVRHTSAPAANMDATTMLTIAGIQGRFTSTTAPGPGSTVAAPSSIDFGGQSINTSAPPVQVTLTNSGGVAATVNAVSVGAGFSVAHDCGSLAPGASCTATVTFTPRASGVFAASLSFQSTPGTQVVSLAGFGERSLTTHYYRSILGRAPDAAGKTFWEAEAARMTGLGANVNETWFAMASAFLSSPEYLAYGRTTPGFLEDLYRTFFNRLPDPGGSAYWSDQLANGAPREVVLTSFMFSPEFAAFTQAIFGSTAARAEVDVVMDFYRGLLSRLPETDGFNYWVGRFRRAQCIGSAAVNQEVDAISSAFLNSPEYLNRARTNAGYVGDLYNAFLRRGGDTAGVRYWIDALATGTFSREAERQRFLASPEFQGRVQRVIAQGCLA